MIGQIKTEMSEHLFDETMSQLELNSRNRLRVEILHLLGAQIWDSCGVNLFREVRSCQ